MTELTVWAPFARRVCADVNGGVVELTQSDDGWWAGHTAETDFDYGFLLDDDPKLLPDPRSRRQPAGVHGPSRTYADTYVWHDGQWQGRGLPGAVIYELHIGTFTDAGTFDAAIERLQYLSDLGITHVEILPVNAFNGVWNWGYDGVDWYAVHEAYGGPDGLKRFVDACHQLGLAAILDVVYNHLGPSGNYLPRFGPYLTSVHNTWGANVNLDGPQSRPVRDYIIDNASMWLTEFHIDGLRLDAVHALQDSSPKHLLSELSEHVETLAREQGRPLELIAESDLNDPKMITPRDQGGYGMDAQWDDDVHHALHALLTGERQGYYCDFGSLAALAKVWTHAFFHDGTYSTFRHAVHGAPVDVETTPGSRFVVCLQNHDQVGNRAAGDRLSALVSTDLLKVGATLLLTSPFTPMLWMGEEWGASTPWPFFDSHPEPELAKATADRRIEEFKTHGWDLSTVIDPGDPEAFFGAKLRWNELDETPHAELLDTYRTLLRLRRDNPDLSSPDLAHTDVSFDEDARWFVAQRGTFVVAVNLADSEQRVPATGHPIFTTGAVGIDDASVVLAARSAAILRR